jgi:hypothetical protein
MQVVRPIKKVFLSAVSSEFRVCRDGLARALRADGFEVHVQEDFTQDGTGTLLQKLEQYIADCDCFVAVIGAAYGAEPPSKLSLPRRSFTQWEFSFAMGERLDGTTARRRAVFKYFASPMFLAQRPVQQDKECRKLQHDFISRIEESGEDRSAFDSCDELIRKVLRDIHGRPGGKSATLLAAYREEILRSVEFVTFDLHGRPVGVGNGAPPYLTLRVGKVELMGPQATRSARRDDGHLRPLIHDFHRRNELQEGMQLREIPVDSLLRTHERRVIFGGAGSGKSTLVRWLARRDVERTGRVALLVNVSSWADSRKPFLQYWAESLFPSIHGRLPTATDAKEVNELVRAAESWLADGLAYIILDGLDEVSGERNRISSLDEASLQQWKHWLARPVAGDKITIVATSRFGSSLTLPGITENEELELLPLRAEDTKGYLRAYFASRRTLEQANNLASDLENALSGDPVMSTLVGNPFFLELAAFVFENEKYTLPTGLPQVFDRAIQSLLEQSPQRTDVPSFSDCGVDPYRARIVLERVAWDAFRRGKRRDIGRSDLLRLLTEKLADIPGSHDAQLLLQALSGRRLFTERGGGYQFLHLSIQEFLAGCHLSDPGAKVDWLDIIERKCWRRDWELLIQFAVGTLADLADGRPRRSPNELKSLVKRLLKSGIDDYHARRVFMASACLSMAPRSGRWKTTWDKLVAQVDKALLKRMRRAKNALSTDHAYLVLLLSSHRWLGNWLSSKCGGISASRISRALLDVMRGASWEWLETEAERIDDYSGWGDPDQRQIYLNRYFKATKQLWFLGRMAMNEFARGSEEHMRLAAAELKKDAEPQSWTFQKSEAILAFLTRTKVTQPVDSEPTSAATQSNAPDDPAALIKMLRAKKSTDATRKQAVRMLAAMPGGEGLSALAAILNDVNQSDYLRQEIVEALPRTNHRAVVSALIGIVQEPGDKDWFREEAAEALANSGNDEAFQFLLEALDSESWELRYPATMGLASTPRPEAHGKLAQLLTFDHSSMLIRSSHSQTVLSLGREYVRTWPVLSDRDLTMFNVRIARGLAGTSNPTALRVLLEVLRTGNGKLRIAAADALRGSMQRRDLWERTMKGEFGEPPDLEDTVESLVVPLWPDYVIWQDGSTSSIDEIDPIDN